MNSKLSSKHTKQKSHKQIDFNGECGLIPQERISGKGNESTPLISPSSQHD